MTRVDENTRVFETLSLPDARRAADLLRERGVEALLRSEWVVQSGSDSDINYRVLVPRGTTAGAVQLLERQELQGDLRVLEPAPEKLPIGRLAAALLVATAIALGTWLLLRQI